MKKKIIIVTLLLACFVLLLYFTKDLVTSKTTTVNLDKLSSIKTYTQEDYEEFLKDYKNNELPKVYITEFIFDGANMYKAYDLDDYVENGNDYETEVFTINALNINTTGNVELTGSFTGMILINTNNIKGDINLILNEVKIDTDSKKVPAIYVYNKDINYTEHKVTITTKKDTKNYIEGGKFKKVSLISSEDIESHVSNADSSDWYNYYSEYSNYYGVYTKDEIENVLFARVQASEDDLKDKDPMYFYKAAGAISSDIDLYFNGEGFLSVTSKNKEGIETKGNLIFEGSSGDYEIYAKDDCLNTTTKEGRNDLVIDVNSLKAIVSNDADEGDAIDSNGTLTIENGNIIAISHPGADAGLDSSKGTYINGGTVIATGDMYDEISNESKQNFMVLSFSGKVNDGETITLKDSDDNIVFEHKTDRSYSNLVYSSSTLTGTYYVYKDSVQYGYSSKGNMGGPGQGGMDPGAQGGPQGGMPGGPQGGMQGPGQGQTANNKEFTIDTISNLFSGVSIYK